MTSSAPADGIHHRTCPLCEATCGLELRVADGRVDRIRGDRDDVFSKGFICPKGSVLHQLHDDPDRLRTPRIRNADGSHREATWDEAFAEVERLLVASRAEHGAESTAIYIGNPNVHGPSLFTLGALAQVCGTKNRFSASSVDQLPREIANGLLYGDVRAWPVPDLDRTELLVIIGANPVVSGGSLATAPDWPGRIDAIRARGGRVVVIDPRRTETATRGGEWLGIVPGTDVLLLAAVATTIFEEGLADLGAAARWCDGIDDVRAALAAYTADAVATRVGVEAEVIRALARDLAASPRSVVYGRVGLQTHAYGTLASWLTDIVNIVAGSLDAPGGQMFASPAAALPANPADYPDGFTIGRWHSRAGGHPECRGEFPLGALADEMLTPGEGQVRSFICLAGNPVLSGPDGPRLERGLAGLDAMVSVDFYRNETSRHAHVILPPPGPLARAHFDLFFYPMAVRNVVNWSPPLHAPDGPTEEEIHLRLAAIVLGMGAGADTSVIGDGLVASIVGSAGGDEAMVGDLDGESVLDRVLDGLLRTGPYDLTLADLKAAPHGIDLGPLEPTLPERLATPDQRIDLYPELIAGDVARLATLLDEPQPDFLLIGRRQLRSNNSWMHNIRVLMKGRHDCTLMVHPDDADALGLAEGDAVTIANETGSVSAPCTISDELRRGVVSLPHGWGHTVEGQNIAVRRPGVNANELTNPRVIDPLSGTVSLNAIAVTLTPVR